MAKKSLRAQLNQIRAWGPHGRTGAWIAHQLEVSTSELREFRRRHELTANGDDEAELDLRDEIEAEIEAATREEELAAEAEEDEDEDEEDGVTDEDADTERAEPRPRRRRRRRGGRGRGSRPGAAMQASFDHGEADGYGLWLDPAIADDPIYTEHWAGKRRVEVSVEPDRIVISRAGEDAGDEEDEDS